MLVINLIKTLRETEGVSNATAWVLLDLAEHRNTKTGACFPFQETVAEECGCSRTTVKAAIDFGIARGWLTMTVRGKYGHRTIYNYVWAKELLTGVFPSAVTVHADADPRDQSVSTGVTGERARRAQSVNTPSTMSEHGRDQSVVAEPTKGTTNPERVEKNDEAVLDGFDTGNEEENQEIEEPSPQKLRFSDIRKEAGKEESKEAVKESSPPVAEPVVEQRPQKKLRFSDFRTGHTSQAVEARHEG
jgi:hypothetical protein